jgi:hypothetical protein
VTRRVSLRKIFLLGAAALASVAALVAIVAVVKGDFGATEGKIFATLAATFVAGSTVTAGLALLARGVLRPLGILGVVLAVSGYVVWAEQIWAGHDSKGYWSFLLILLAFTLAILAATVNRLLASTPKVVKTLFPATAAAATLAAAIATMMVLRDNGDGWEFFAVLLILTVLGEILTPIFDRYLTVREPDEERPLATVGDVSVVAVRGRGGTVRIGETEHRLAADEGILVRRR